MEPNCGLSDNHKPNGFSKIERKRKTPAHHGDSDPSVSGCFLLFSGKLDSNNIKGTPTTPLVMTFPINLSVYRGRSRGKDNAPSPLSAPSVRTPRAYYTAVSPAPPAVPGCYRTRPPRRCSRWQGWCMTFANVAMAKPL